MKIVQLTTENTKRLRVVEITPKGDVIVISGRNGQGKSSLLDSIDGALRGADAIPAMPVRKGAAKAKTVVHLQGEEPDDDLLVTRTFTAAGGTSLVVKTKDGKPQLSPQAILDKLWGKRCFNPLEFARDKKEKQAATLRQITGLDFTTLDQERTRLANERTIVGRECDTAKGALASCPKIPDAPAEEQSAVAILEEQRKASEANAANKSARDEADRIEDSLRAVESERTQTEQAINDLESALKKKREHLEVVVKTVKETDKKLHSQKAKVAALVDVDVSVFQQKLSQVETTNVRVRQNKRHAELDKTHKAKAKAYDDLTRKIEALDEQKRTATETAKMPVPGLSFTAIGGVALNGIPFEQVSSADQLKVSVAIGLALHPKLKVLLLREGSLLDEDSMRSIAEIAATHNAQLWVERVEVDAHTSVVIEDGQVVEQPEPQQKELV